MISNPLAPMYEEREVSTMELSITLDYLEKGKAAFTGRSLDLAAALCSEAGIRFVDYTSNFNDDQFTDLAKRERDILDAHGITVEQCHAPFNRYGSYPTREEFTKRFSASFEVAKILGAKYIVVHADELHPSGDIWDVQDLINRNYDDLAPFAEFCKKNGMVMAIENLFEDKTWRVPQVEGKSRFTSRVEEQIGLIDRFQDPCVAACWDFGHACCAFGKDDMTEALRSLGGRLVCTHVHDNNYRQDNHLIPFLGEIDWKAQMRTLREIGYDGKLSFEFVYGHIPDNIVRNYLSYIVSVGNELLTY